MDKSGDLISKMIERNIKATKMNRLKKLNALIEHQQAEIGCTTQKNWEINRSIA